MRLEQDDIRGLLNPFITSLKSTDDFTEQHLFDGREALKLVFDRINTNDKRSQAQAFWSIQAMIGALIRKGSVDQKTALTAIGDLLESLVDWAEAVPGGGSAAFSLAPPLPGEAPQAKQYLKLANGPLGPVPGSNGAEALQPGPAPSTFVPTHENCLGQLLVQSGKLSNESLSRALTLQKINGRRLGEVLIAMEAVGIQTLEEALVRQKFLNNHKTVLPTTQKQPRLRLDR
ncbi:MAG: hypothetical protein P1V35_08775 [Planctomycetota bacterium]|nr:hypothetical protein [Planctomycetota bacterium]